MIHDLDEFKNIPIDYDSPINIVVNQMADEIARFTEDGVMQAVVKVGFDIDKDKLVSILQQDRERYQSAYRSGYAHGYQIREDEIVRCRDCINHECTDMYGDWICEIDGSHRSPDWYCADGKKDSL